MQSVQGCGRLNRNSVLVPCRGNKIIVGAVIGHFLLFIPNRPLFIPRGDLRQKVIKITLWPHAERAKCKSALYKRSKVFAAENKALLYCRGEPTKRDPWDLVATPMRSCPACCVSGVDLSHALHQPLKVFLELHSLVLTLLRARHRRKGW